jgi:hypothetical protein
MIGYGPEPEAVVRLMTREKIPFGKTQSQILGGTEALNSLDTGGVVSYIFS